MRNLHKTAALALAASTMAMAAPASATIFEYEMTNGDILTIDTEKKSGTWVGNNINVQFAGNQLANFPGGATPVFSHLLTSMTGTRTINGTDYTPTRTNGSRYHDWMIKSASSNRINLWSWWGNPVIAGDYVKTIASYRVVDVPAPGMLGLFALALAAVGVGRRRRRKAVAA